MSTIKPPMLLLAMPHVRDGFFEKSVILITEHNAKGAFGVALNRLSPLHLEDVIFMEQKLPITKSIPVWLGGPVELGSATILEHLNKEREDDLGFLLHSNEAILVRLMDHFSSELNINRSVNMHPKNASLFPYRFIVGFSSWMPQQLDRELAAGDWLQIDYDEELIFNTEIENIWQNAFMKLGIAPSQIAANTLNRSGLH
ncbi:MAG: YqgE/AlgH family protein [Oligoflexales bacterium]|nr:YqgE/AlgH family protein [Oligoflexales bacterium]